MHNLVSVLENDTHKVRLDFDIHTDDLISIRSDLIISKSEVGDRSRGRPEGSLFNSYYTEL